MTNPTQPEQCNKPQCDKPQPQEPVETEASELPVEVPNEVPLPATTQALVTVNNGLLPKGCEACGKPKCSWCKRINKTTIFTSSNNDKIFKICHSVNCQSSWGYLYYRV